MTLRTLFALLEIARPHNMIAAMACVASGYILADGKLAGEAVPVMILTGLVTALGNMVNDCFDADIDRINKPRRPIPSGRLSSALVMLFYGTGSVIVTALAIFFLEVPVFLFVLIWEILLFLYGWRAKRMFLLGNLLVSTVAASAFIVGALAAGDIRSAAFPFLFAFLFVFGRELVKGAEDVDGDRLSGNFTFAARYGVEETAVLASLLLLLCVVVAPLPSVVLYYGRTYFFIMELIFIPGVLGATYLVIKRPKRAVLNRASWILKIEMLVGIIAMAAGRA